MMSLLQHWLLTAFSLWVASYLFRGIKFADTSSLFIAALVLGLVNASVRPLLYFFTFPLTVLTLGLFLLVINALMIQLVAALVKGFTVSSFWTAFFVSIFLSLFGALLGLFADGDRPALQVMPQSSHGVWL